MIFIPVHAIAVNALINALYEEIDDKTLVYILLTAGAIYGAATHTPATTTVAVAVMDISYLFDLSYRNIAYRYCHTENKGYLFRQFTKE